ncbi:MAG: TetR/AcrR family transcriptional regulator [Actinomycetota bacterium]|nr:TetR/AcrR family transcriptional regulator [Actinomycetota bacterium]MDA3012725.1 TetR/AcrR family transcriptional regulator [Actinomycetota bacterium]MDA3029331.1 TetR/AcrR family transcriptional regulator [Actinomycetota bacterium]
MSARRTTTEIREAVITAAQEILAESGPLTFRMSELIKRSGVSESVVYRHFTDRDHVVIEALIVTFESQIAEIRRILPEYLERVDALDPDPGTVADALAMWIIGDGSPEALYKQVLRSRLDVAVVEFPEIAERVAALQRERDQLAEIIVSRLRERFSNTVWAISSESFGLLMNGLIQSLLVRGLDPTASQTKSSRDEFSTIIRVMLESFSRRIGENKPSS